MCTWLDIIDGRVQLVNDSLVHRSGVFFFLIFNFPLIHHHSLHIHVIFFSCVSKSLLLFVVAVVVVLFLFAPRFEILFFFFFQKKPPDRMTEDSCTIGAAQPCDS